MRWSRCGFLAFLASAAVVLACGSEARADQSTGKYFYFGYDYGSQALYNPLWVFVNRSFDVLQIRAGDRNVFEQEYASNGANVLRNVAHPTAAVSDLGWGPFLKQEVLPLSWRANTARWTPNYSLHLLGGGMTYAALREWYEAHGVPLPWLFSSVTVMTSALVNETLENKGIRGRNTDCLADLYLFDLGGILLFSVEPVKRFFGRELMIADWSLQPTFTFPGADLHNQGNYFAAKWALPFHKPLRLFSYFGLSTMFGLSYKIAGEYSVSAAGGARSTRLVNLSTNATMNTVSWAPSGGLFVDRNNSVLAALQVSNVQDYFVSFNLYPNAILRTDPGVGLWTVVDKQGHFIVGAVTTLTFGVGLGFGRLPVQ